MKLGLMKKGDAVIAEISDLTSEQSAQLVKEITKAKSKYAPHGRGTVASGKKNDVGMMLQSGTRKQLNTKKG